MKKAPKPPVIVIVDDEEIVLRSIGSFLELETDYEVLTFASPFSALDELNRRPVDLVISDFLMPDMNGLQFLKSVKELYPEIPLVLLTGYADKENAIRAINEIGLFQYIEKPWDNEQIKMVIRNGLQSKELHDILKAKLKELDNVLRKHDELAHRDTIIKKELALARKLQNNILPENPYVKNHLRLYAKYKPALEIGGDFYDVINLSDNRLAVLVADVTGHGIQAALSTTLLKFVFAHYEDSVANPSEIIRGMNKILHQILPNDIFVAATLVTIDKTSGKVAIINAGNPHPYLIRRAEGEVEKLAASGLILGVADENVYQPGEECHLSLRENQYLLLYTDGLSEAQNEAGVRFEEAFLPDFLQKNAPYPLQEILDTLLTEVESFLDRGNKDDSSHDDITIIGIELRSNREN